MPELYNDIIKLIPEFCRRVSTMVKIKWTKLPIPSLTTILYSKNISERLTLDNQNIYLFWRNIYLSAYTFALVLSFPGDIQEASGWDRCFRDWGLRIKMSLLGVFHVYCPEVILNPENICYLKLHNMFSVPWLVTTHLVQIPSSIVWIGAAHTLPWNPH